MSWAVTAAASIALLVGSALFLHTPGHVAPPIADAPRGPVEPAADDVDIAAALVQSTATGLGQWVESTLDDNQWAGLDRDAKTAMATVTGPLPFDFSLAIADSDPAH